MATTKAAKRSSTSRSTHRWSASVTSDSTHPGSGLFKKSAKTIADSLATKEVSPRGPGQGMQMLSFYENRAGKNLSAERRRTLEDAKDLLREKEGKQHAAHSGSGTKKKTSTKNSTVKARA